MRQVHGLLEVRGRQRAHVDAGSGEQTGLLFSYVSCEARVPAEHPFRLIRAVMDEALDVLWPEFDQLYARVGRPGIAAEKLLQRRAELARQKRSNETRRSITDPDARLARKSNGQASILAYAGHVLMENRNGLIAHSCLTHATGTAERDAALVLVDRLARRRIMLGADKGAAIKDSGPSNLS